ANIFFKNSRPRDVGYFRLGTPGRPDIRKVMESDRRGWMNPSDMYVLLRRVLPTKRNQKLQLVIDQSVSMSGEKAKRAMETLVMFMERLEFLGIDYEVIGFSDGASIYKEFGRGRLSEHEKNEVINDVEKGNMSGGTDDKSAIELATQ